MPNVTRVEYRKDRKNLCVQYRERVWYTYEQVPEHVANAIRRAPSRGKAIWDLVRVRGTRYGHRYAYYKAPGNECRETFLSRAAGALQRLAVAAGGAAWAVGGMMRGLGKRIAQKLKARKEAEAARQRREAEALQRELELARRRARIKIHHPPPRAPQPEAQILNVRRIFTPADRIRRQRRRRRRLWSGALQLWRIYRVGKIATGVFHPARFMAEFVRLTEGVPTIIGVQRAPQTRVVSLPFQLPTEFTVPRIDWGELVSVHEVGLSIEAAVRHLIAAEHGAVSTKRRRLFRAVPLENIVSIRPLSPDPITVVIQLRSVPQVLEGLLWREFLQRLPRWQRAWVAHWTGNRATLALEMSPLAQTPEFVQLIDQLLESHPELLERFR